MSQAAVITGASSGIGAACARRLLQEGWRVAAMARREQPLAALGEAFPGQVLPVPADLADAAAIDRTVAAIAAWQPSIQAVVCAAGDFLVRPMEATSSAEFERLWRLTVWSKFYLVRALLPLLAAPAQPARAVIHLASLAAHHDFADETAYTSAMHGVIGLARAQDVELKGRGIRVAVVSPGLVRTPLTERSFPAEVLTGALAPEAIAGSVETLIATIAAGGYIPEIFHVPQNST
ncbi:MAG: SDR family oxidoreductase [Acidobacteria bacterium]|nr:MAG: SDR family oxidoreductase [Acidobacteriota bacterium]